MVGIEQLTFFVKLQGKQPFRKWTLTSSSGAEVFWPRGLQVFEILLFNVTSVEIRFMITFRPEVFRSSSHRSSGSVAYGPSSEGGV